MKGDIGIKDGRIVGVGKAGNPDVMDVTPGLVVSANTDILSVEGMIATPGGIDVHVHFDCAQLAWEALSNGITSMIGGGTGPKTVGIDAPGAFNLQRMIDAFAGIPVNMGQLGKGNSSKPRVLVEQALGGAIGLKLHEDWGTTPATIDTCLRVADDYDFQVQIHTDTLNEAGFLERTLASIGGRTIHTYHTEGAGGGHAPDIIRVAGEPNCLPSSTNPTNPFTVNTVDEHLDMIMTCHHLNPLVPEDVAFAESRIRAETIAAEDVLHDLGAISMLGSDSQGMGRIGETVTRTWQLAASMKAQRGRLRDETGDDDNQRVLRYLAKYTLNPAITFGIERHVGSFRPGTLADIVIWRPGLFGAKPEVILKGGFIAWAAMGDANASLMTCQPILYRPQYGAYGANVRATCVTFVTQAALDANLSDRIHGDVKLVAVRGTRTLGKAHMVRNGLCPEIRVDPETYKVFVNGERVTCRPARVLPLTQRYFLR